ncbi:MAG: response regulator, partial [Cyanobacteria bacterium J06635_10]
IPQLNTRRLLRRGKVNLKPVLEWGALQLDPTSCEVIYKTEILSLTPQEYSLLELFLRNSRRVFSCGIILEHLWSYEDIPSEEAVRTHIKGLRMKLKAAGAPSDLIETVYGIGYRLKPRKEERGRGREGERERGREGDSGSHREVKVSALRASGVTRGEGDEEKISSQATKAQTLLAIAGVWEKYKGRVSEQVHVLLKAVQALQTESMSSELHSQAAAQAHTLAGSLGTFGFTKGSKIARRIENLLSSDKILDENEIAQLHDWVKTLLSEIDSPIQTWVTSPENQNERPLVLVVDTHHQIPEDLAIKAADWGLEIAIANDISTARQKLYQEHPSVAIVNADILEDNDDLSLLTEFKNRKPPIPVLVLTEQTDVIVRLQVIHNCGNTILQKPASSAQVLEAVTELIKNSEDAQATVLAVDDDEKVLEVLQKLLKYWGITVKTLCEPEKFWETLETTKPDLLILDVEMPGVNGIELCHELRNNSQWSEIPVLFLTVYTQAEIINQVFSIGADDFVSKPIVGPELVTRIVNRLERIKCQQRMTKVQEKQNHPSAERWRKIFDTSPECIKLIAADGTLLEMNPAGLAMIEGDETAIGKNIYSVIAPEYRQAFEDLNKSICQGNKGSLEFEIIGFKGSRRFVETHGVPLGNPQNDRVVQLALTRDMTARKQAEAEKERINLLLRAKVRQQASVAQLGQSALLNKDISAFMDETVTLVAQALEVEFSQISEILPSGNAMVLRAGVGWHEGLIKQALLNFNDCLAADTLVTKEPVISLDLRQESRFNNPALLEEYGIISGASVPIFASDRTYGVLGVYTQHKRAFNQDDIHFLQAIANVLSGAIEKQRIETSLLLAKEELENKVAQRTAELVEMNKRLQLELEQRQLAQEKLRDSQAQFAGIVDIASDAIISIDSNQCITLFNQGAQDIFGYSVSEVLGKPLDVLLPEGSVAAHRHHVADFGKSPTSARKMGERREINGRRKDGSEFPADASISKLKVGEKIVYTVYLQDVSSRKQIERMKNEFVSVVSHELRTPLTSIHCSLGMLSRGLIEGSSDYGKRLLQIATDSSECLVRLINDILDIERIESGKVTMDKQPCEISDLIAQAVLLVQPLADKAQVKLSLSQEFLSEKISQAISLREATASNKTDLFQYSTNQLSKSASFFDELTGNNSPIIRLRADCDRIIQVLINLLSNAIRFSASGDTVWLAAFEQDSSVLFAVKDTGCGIEQDKLEIIFERFQQVDSSDSRNHEGTGLGLAICRSIVELHGGSIWAESVMGVGSTFYFTLPLLSE